MISFILSFINSALLLFVFKDKIQTAFYSDFVIKASFNAINLYSKGQLFCRKMYKNLKIRINDTPLLQKAIGFATSFNVINKRQFSENRITQFDGETLYMKKITPNINTYFYEDNNNDNIYVYSDYEKRNIDNSVNHRILYSQPFSFDYEVSNVKFLLVELKIAGKKLKLNLKNELDNYYVVSNTFDKNFFLYYLRNYSHTFNCELIYDEMKCNIDCATVSIIDHNANVVELDMERNGRIIILKNDYFIKHD
jgi:hypothetical protein